MELISILEVAGQLKAGSPLPWGVRDGTGKLLLARGHTLTDPRMVQALLERGMFVDAGEVRATGRGGKDPIAVPKQGFLGRWRGLLARLTTLLTSPQDNFAQAMVEVVDVLLGMADRESDKMLFQILRHDHSRPLMYGLAHSLHTAGVCCLTARRMGWPEAQLRSLVSAALTMNISMLELQGRLAVQHTRPNTEQRNAINSHPARSVQMLRDAGVTDAVWLQAVEQHHETPDGKGYPAGLTEVSDTALMLHFVDVFTAKISARALRAPMLPNQAARDIFTQNNGHPLAAVLVKEFGIYPPGCFVKLVSGETAVVVHRGENANTPQVFCLTNRNGDALNQPMRRDTSVKEHSVVAVVPESNMKVRVPWEALYLGE